MKIPTYIINLKKRTDRKEHILGQFKNRDEFDVNFIEACEDKDGRIGLWKSLCKIINIAKEKDLEYVLVCEDDHFFTDNYNKDKFQEYIETAKKYNCHILNGGIGGYGETIKVTDGIFWVDWFWCTQFMIVYRNMYDKILEYHFKSGDTEDGVLSNLTFNHFVIWPFISEQAASGYSDVTAYNNAHPDVILTYFYEAKSKLNKTANFIKQFEELREHNKSK